MDESVETKQLSGRKLDLIPRLGGVPYGREMQAHVLELAARFSGKAIPSRDAGFKSVPERSETHVDVEDCHAVLARIEAIYCQAAAFCPPWEMDRRLIETSGRAIPAEALDLAEDYGKANRTQEPLTGGHRKAQAPLMTATAHIYGQARHEQVFIFDLDYFNFDGTNRHFYKVLCAAEGRTDNFDSENKPLHEDLYRRAMALTDRFARIVAEIPYEKILSAAEGASVERLRTGGDEVRYIGTRIPQDAPPRIVGSIHSAFEDLTRDLGLHDYDYGKNARLKHRRGGGAAISAFRLGEPGTPYHIAANAAEEEQTVFKNEIGRGRLSDFFIGHRQSSTKARYDNTTSALDYLKQIDSALEHYELKYRIKGVIGPESWIEEGKKYYQNTRSHAIEPLVEQARFTHVPTPEDLRALLAAQYRGDLNERKITLRPEDEKLVGLLFLKYPYPDYVTNTAMDSDFPMMAGLTRDIARRNRAEFLDTLPGDQRKDTGAQIPSLWGLGVKFHNIKGYNASLGHEATNAVLNAVANAVLKAALRDSGIGEKGSCLAHYGGGTFLATVLPVLRETNGSFRLIGPEHFQTLEKALERRMAELNNANIKDFLALHDVPLPAGVSEGMKLGDVVNGDVKERGWKDGLTYTMTRVDLSAFEKSLRRDKNVGGAIAGMVQTFLNQSVAEKDARLHAGHLRHSGAPPAPPSPG